MTDHITYIIISEPNRLEEMCESKKVTEEKFKNILAVKTIQLYVLVFELLCLAIWLGVFLCHDSHLNKHCLFSASEFILFYRCAK